MFIEVHNANATSGPKLAFLKSLNVQAFPCGRRRSECVDFDDQNNDGLFKNEEKYYIPYDPEARLNTEANNRQHSSLNGFTQNYIKDWDAAALTLSVGGYLFIVKTQYESQDILGYEDAFDAFGKTFVKKVGDTGSSIYANIRIEEVPLYSGFTTYYTSILRDQTTEAIPSASIDMLISNTSPETLKNNPENCFYFAGLSFSTSPLAGDYTGTPDKELLTTKDDGSIYQRTISLRILDKVDSGVWKLHQPALLPKIQHGKTENSVKLNTVYADTIMRGTYQVPALNLSKVDTKDNGDEIYKLSFLLN